jgi:aspartyl-tRNA(Asn)/glutamyl-tRNA(Gln) amidotransferase subunit A
MAGRIYLMSASDTSLLDLGIRAIGDGFRRRTWSPVDVVRAALERIASSEPELHAWVLVDPERALEGARQAERELMTGTDRSVLHGIPIGIKDIFDVAGWPTRCGSAARDDAAPAKANASSVQTLIDGGAVILGKTTTQEFAAGTVSPPARNPWDPSRIPGGSSGGSAAAVAVGSCLGAMGSDTGGSIRIPAAACGVTGFKPAFGQLDVAGVFPLSWSLDTIGPIARTVDDTWIMWNALSNSDASVIAAPTLSGDGRPCRIGIPRSFFFDSLQPDVRAAVGVAIDKVRDAGVTIIDTPWPDAAAARACGFIINRVETAAVHERAAIEDPSRFSQYGKDLRLRVGAGRTVPAAVYLKATRARGVLRDSMARLFAQYAIDALLVPTLPTAAIDADRLVIEGTGLDESVGVAWTRLTMPFNATGQPVLAIPCGLDRDRLPVGIQLAGIPGHETALFEIASLVERALDFHRAHRPLARFETGAASEKAIR